MLTFRSGGKPIGITVARPSGVGPFPALLLLHGSGGNISFWLDRMRPHLQHFGIALFAVHYFDRTGTTRADAATILDGVHFPQWMETVKDAISAVASESFVDSTRMGLIGISLGAFLAMAIVGDEPRLRVVTEISGGMPDGFAPGKSASLPPTLIVHGLADSVVPVRFAHELAGLLQAREVPHQVELLPGEGHWFSPAAQMRILLAVASFLGRYLSPFAPAL